MPNHGGIVKAKPQKAVPQYVQRCLPKNFLCNCHNSCLLLRFDFSRRVLKVTTAYLEIKSSARRQRLTITGRVNFFFESNILNLIVCKQVFTDGFQTVPNTRFEVPNVHVEIECALFEETLEPIKYNFPVTLTPILGNIF